MQLHIHPMNQNKMETNNPLKLSWKVRVSFNKVKDDLWIEADDLSDIDRIFINRKRYVPKQDKNDL